MAQEIVTWCDVHLNEEEFVKGRAVTLTVLSRKPRTVDLCDDCTKEILGPVQELLDEHGRTPSMAPKSVPAASHSTKAPEQHSDASDTMCPMEGCTYGKPFRHRSSLRAHVETVHDEDLATLEGRAGQTFDGDPIIASCDVTGCEAGFATRQGLGAHRRFRHPELFQ